VNVAVAALEIAGGPRRFGERAPDPIRLVLDEWWAVDLALEQD
jgi:hypothetical protein